MRALSFRLTSAVVVTALLAFLGGAGTACKPEDDDDDTPPRVVGVEPVSPLVPVTTTFRVAFSEELNDSTVIEDPIAEDLTIVLVPRFNEDDELIVTEQFLTDLESGGLIESRQNALVPVIVSLVDGDTALTIAPRTPLLPGTAYTLIVSGEVRDTAGNPLVDASGLKAPFVWEVTTDAGPPAVVATDIGAAGIVVPNRKRIGVTFNQPVVGVDSGSLRIDGAPAARIEAILMDADRRGAVIVLAEPSAGCERLGANAAYTLVATSDIVGDNGEPLESYSESITASATCDLVPNALSGLEDLASDVAATVRFTTSKPSTTEVRFGVAGGPLDCLGQPCPVVGAPTTVANGVHTVAIGGLSVDVDYRYVVVTEDQVGFVASASGGFITEALPKLSVNEALADAPGTGQEDAGEFVEIASFDPAASIALAGWTLRITNARTGTVSTSVLPVDAPSLAPGAFLVLGHPELDTTLYGAAVDESLVFRYAAFSSLSNSDALVIELLEPGDRPVSSLSVPAARDGKSYERTAPDAADAADNVCSSREDVGPTPGRTNGVAERGCE